MAGFYLRQSTRASNKYGGDPTMSYTDNFRERINALKLKKEYIVHENVFGNPEIAFIEYALGYTSR